MNSIQNPHLKFDFLALGESVVDFISSDPVANLGEAAYFERFAGGQVANLAMNMARLGNRVALGSCVGEDGFGQLIRQKVGAAGVDLSCLQISSEAPTTLIPVTRTTRGTPDFSVYRGADTCLQPNENLLDAAAHSGIVHTSAFALSREPARSTILQALEVARQNGQRVSFDPNFHPRIWPDVADFKAILQAAFRYVNITKPSLDDCIRLFGAGFEPAEYAAHFLQWGAEIVAISLGAEGTFLATHTGEQYRLVPNLISVADVTGAGDAFWSGFLTALLDGHSPLDAIRSGQVVAEIKISRIGPLTANLDRTEIFSKAQLIQYQPCHM